MCKSERVTFIPLALGTARLSGGLPTRGAYNSSQHALREAARMLQCHQRFRTQLQHCSIERDIEACCLGGQAWRCEGQNKHRQTLRVPWCEGRKRRGPQQGN